MIRASSFAALLVSVISSALAAQTPSPSISAPPALAAPSSATKVTPEQAAAWKDKPVFSSDDKKIGEVESLTRGPDGAVLDLLADIGGVMGIGETRIRLTPTQFALQAARVVLTLTAEQARSLPNARK